MPTPIPTPSAALLLAATLLLAACSSGEPVAAASNDAPAAASGGATSTGLRASVGTDESPDAFEIELLDASGAPVRSLPAGAYTITVNDRSEIHNFAISGSGVEEATSVADTGEFVLEVALEAGEYDYVCTPHPSMNGSFSVT